MTSFENQYKAESLPDVINGLYVDGDEIKLGGDLIETTTINLNENQFTVSGLSGEVYVEETIYPDSIDNIVFNTDTGRETAINQSQFSVITTAQSSQGQSQIRVTGEDLVLQATGQNPINLSQQNGLYKIAPVNYDIENDNEYFLVIDEDGNLQKTNNKRPDGQICYVLNKGKNILFDPDGPVALIDAQNLAGGTPADLVLSDNYASFSNNGQTINTGDLGINHIHTLANTLNGTTSLFSLFITFSAPNLTTITDNNAFASVTGQKMTVSIPLALHTHPAIVELVSNNTVTLIDSGLVPSGFKKIVQNRSIIYLDETDSPITDSTIIELLETSIENFSMIVTDCNQGSDPIFASGSVLAANVCIGSVVNVPTGNISDVKTVGTGGDFPDFQSALADPNVVNGTILKLIDDIETTTTINVNKAVIIDLNGNTIYTSESNPVTVLNITAGAVIKNGVIKHLKTTNTSVETVVNINSPSAPVYVINNEIQIQEFGIVARGRFYIGNNYFNYIGSSATNSHRFIMLNGVSGESRIYNNEFECSLKQGTTRYSNFIYATSGSTYSGKLFINNNTQLGGDLRQFFLHDSGVPTGMELYVANNEFNDFNGGIGIVGVNVYNGYSKIGIYNNTQGDDSAGNYKGLFFVDGTGAINEDVVVEYGDNTLGTTALRADYLSYSTDGSSEIAIKNTITFLDKKEKVGIEESLNGLGLIIQELKGRKTYISGVTGSGTEYDPYIVIPTEPTGLVTTSLTPQHFNAGWVDSNNTSVDTVAKLMELSDGSLVDDVDVTWTGHGLDIGEIYYLDSVSGGYTKTVPTSPNYTQQLFIVKDANTIHVDIEQAYVSSGTDSVTFGTSAPTSPSSTAQEGDIYFQTSDGTASGSVISTYVYDKTSDKWVAASASSEITTTSLAPKTGNGTAYVNPTLVSETTLVDEIQLSDGSYIRSGQVTFTGHGLPIHTYFYASATAPYYTATVPTTGWSQQLFYTQDANTIDVLIQEGVNLDIINGGGSNPTFAKTVYVNATSPTTATIFDLNNPPTTNDNTLKADANNIYIGTDGSTWTYNSSTITYSTYTFPTTVPHGFFAQIPQGTSVANNTLTRPPYSTLSNTAGGAWNPATGTFTAQRAGWYNVSLAFLAASGSWGAGTQAAIAILKNGAIMANTVVTAPVAIANGNIPSASVSANVYLNAGDVVRSAIYQNSGSAKATHTAVSNAFSIVEVR